MTATDVVQLTAPDGASATIALHGGHVLSWKPTGGAEQLYLSPRSEYVPGKAIRGGVPVCFPQFAERGPLPKHGFARTLPWELDRPLSDIDWTASLVQSPVPVPGMTTLRRRMAHEPEPEGTRPLARLDLYLDASGSVPDPAKLRSPLVLAAAILTLSALRIGLAVRVTCSVRPGTERMERNRSSRNLPRVSPRAAMVRFWRTVSRSKSWLIW